MTDGNERKTLKEFIESEISKGNYVGRAGILEFDLKNQNYLRNMNNVDKMDEEIMGLFKEVQENVEYVECNYVFQNNLEFCCGKFGKLCNKKIGYLYNNMEKKIRKLPECKDHAFFNNCTSKK